MSASDNNTASNSDEDVSWPEEKPLKEEISGETLDEKSSENKIFDKSIMEPEQPQQTSSQNSSFGLEMKESKNGGKNWLLIVGLILLVIALAGGGYFFFKSSLSSSDVAIASPVESPFALASPVASPMESNAPSVEIDRTLWDLEVMNGTGKTGLAATVKSKLEDMGYTVSKTGNATEAETTKILVNKKMAADQDALLADLKSEFNVESAGILTDSSASARIVLGKDYLK